MPGRALDQVGVHGLDGVDDEQRGRLAVLHGGEDVADRSRGGEPHRGAAEAEANGAQPHLLGRFLAGDVDHPVTFAREARSDLEQQGRFADAGIAADQHRRPGDDPAADRPVELGEAARKPLG